MRTICLVAERYDPSGVFTFISHEPSADEVEFIQSGDGVGVHAFVGKRYTFYVITPMVEVPREYALYIATSYSEREWERIVDWKLANDSVSEEIRTYLRRRHEQLHKTKAKKPHRKTSLSTTQGE
jgi:hypothetical protein